MKAKKTATKKVYPEPGVTVATLCQILDWGSQIDKYSGDDGRAKVEFIWELPTQLHVFNEEKGEQPLIVTRKYGNTLGRGSAMKADIEAMLGHKIDSDFELDSLLDEMCMLNLSLEQEGEYTNVVIQSLMPLTKELARKKYPRFNDQFVLDLDNFDLNIWNKIPEWKQKEIMKSPECAEALANVPTNGKPTAQKQQMALSKEPGLSRQPAKTKASPFAAKAIAKGGAGKGKK